MSREELINYLTNGFNNNNVFILLKQAAEYNGKTLPDNIVNILQQNPILSTQLVELVINEFLDRLSIDMNIIKVYDKQGNLVRYC